MPGPLRRPVTLTADPPSSSQARSPITLTANVSGGYGPLHYQFNVQNPDGHHSILSDFSPSQPVCGHRKHRRLPTDPIIIVGRGGRYWHYRAQYRHLRELDYVITALPLTSVTLVTNPAGSGFTYHPVKLIASANGGGQPEYKFIVSYRDINDSQQLDAR